MPLRVVALKDMLSKKARLESRHATSDMIYDGKSVKFEPHDPNDILVVGRGGVNAYYRGPNIGAPLKARVPEHKPGGPLLTSHLQKAVRVGAVEAALQSTATLMYGDRLKLLRRLPIIMVEDSAFVPGTAIVVWLMITHGSWTFTENDASHVLEYVRRMTLERSAIDARGINKHAILTHAQVEACGTSQTADLRSLLIRRAHGGMKGDMWRLSNAVHICCAGPPDVKPSTGTRASIDDVGFLDLRGPDFLPAAIDYHPFPWILGRIASAVPSVTKGRAKQLIWVVDSGPNIRKPSTLRRRDQAVATADWGAMMECLATLRHSIIESACSNADFPPARGGRRS